MEIFDSILKYLSIATVAGAAISFVVGLIKYLDQRNREEKTKRYEIYHGLMRKISAQGDKPNEGLPLTQQVAAVYELQQFPEYANGSVPILNHLRSYFASLNSPKVLLEAIDGTILQLKQTQSNGRLK